MAAVHGGACETLTVRPEGPGTRRGADPAAGVMDPPARYESGRTESYWFFRAGHPDGYQAAA